MKLTKLDRVAVLVSVGLLGCSFVLPLWKIALWAPQYPEGLVMRIGINKITGNLEQINLLNHYIGMQYITPESIPELKIMPVVMASLLLLGLGVAFFAGRRSLLSWFSLLFVTVVAGIYDFWAWGYSYGNKLSDDAPIKIPGMTYEPPILGHKQILNIHAYSYPDFGGWAIGIALLLILITLLNKNGFLKKILPVKNGVGVTALVALIAMSGCKVTPAPIEPQVDHCETCKMTISDVRYSGEVMTLKGRKYKFDSLSCLLSFVKMQKEGTKAIWVSDYLNPSHLIDVKEARFLKSNSIKSPMGDHFIASLNENGLRDLQKDWPGDLMEWNTILVTP